MTDVSIVIINKNNYQALNKLINSIKYQTSKPSFELLIIADQDDCQLTNYFDTHPIECKRIPYGNDNYLDTLNKTIKDAHSEHIFIIEDKYILGRNFFKNLLQTNGDEKTLLHPEYNVLYNGKTGLKQYGNNLPKGGLFEKTIYENIIYANKKSFNEVKFTNPFGNEFWQFYCDTLALEYTVKIANDATIFENISRMNASQDNSESVLIKTGLFEGDNMLNIKPEYVLKKGRNSLDLFTKSISNKGDFKKLIRNYVNGINLEYLDISNKGEYTLLLEEWRGANKIEPLLFPEKFLINNIELIDAEFEGLVIKYLELESQYEPETRYLFLIPSSRIGGGTKVIKNYIEVLLTKYNPKEITVVTTDDVNNDFSLLPPGVNVINLKKICDSNEDMMCLLLRLIMQKNPYAIHLINSEIGYTLFAKYAKFISNTSKLYLTYFMPSISKEGKIIGHMLEYLPLFYDYLIAVSTDNRTVVGLMDKLYGMGTEKYTVHYQPVEIQKDIWNERERSLVKTKSKDGPITILWASRIDYQKNIPLLYDIAKHYTNEPKGKRQVKFLIAGIVEEDSKEIFNKLIKLPNLKYFGPFKNVRDLPIKECDLFLYTSISDGIPNILLEIMASGEIPILASSVGAVTELIGESNGVLCETIGDFINAINKYIENSSIYDSYVQDSLLYIINNHNPNQLIANIKEFKDYY